MTSTLSQNSFDATRWEQLLVESARRHQVPGIVAGVLRIDPDSGVEQRFVASTGVTNSRTGVETSRDALCQIGSVTKLVTSTMIMQLREEGKLDLDTLITDLLPDTKLSTQDDGTITVHHLLTHTSGINGDVFTDTGRGDDCIEKYVALLKDAEPLFSPGNGWSYCNSGFVVLGRIIELLDGRTWDASVQARISARLDLQHFLTLPEQIMSHRYQHGHTREPGSTVWSPAARTALMRSVGPAGIINSSVDDMLDFGRSFLRDGRGTGGTALLSPESVRLMFEPQVDLGDADALSPQWGLGWILDEWEGHRVVWHGGTTIGNKAWFQVLPEDGVVIVVFCNGGVANAAGADIVGAFAREFAGVSPAPGVTPAGPATDVVVQDEWLGKYGDFITTFEIVKTDAGTLEARLSQSLKPEEPGDEIVVELFPTEQANRFTGRPDRLTSWVKLTFAEVDGHPCLYSDIRCLRKQVAAESAD
ncbi:serine hydrolase domain-containing protein [Leucobacter komagatae]|uniref:serine hydrolase domain-containing protein n=1 Tax=Leucobacter komagatae TaxID=55969 RepID=UPI00069640A5|nr:serine hydrolase domain-containing protein [Leucobacter komagatae]